jgi:oxygen-independent coproporphyrinogen-3 oxidase
MATETAARPEDWLGRVEADGTGVTAVEPIEARDQAAEMLLMGLRLREGIDMERYAALAGRKLDPDTFRGLENSQLIERNGEFVKATDSGRLLLNRVIAALAA